MNDPENAPDYWLMRLEELELTPAAGIARDVWLAALSAGCLLLSDCQRIRDLMLWPRDQEDTADCPKDCLQILLAALMIGVNEGSPGLRCDSDADYQPWLWLNKRLKLPEAKLELLRQAWEQIQSRLADNSCSFLAQRIMNEQGNNINRPVVAVEQLLKKNQLWLYFQLYFHHERMLSARLGNLTQSALVANMSLERALKLTEDASGYKDFDLDAEQKMALYLALRQRFAIITGGPGTGKTTLVCSLLRALLAAGVAAGRIVLVAPTGRAGQRMGESLRSSIAKAPESLPEEHRKAIAEMQGSTIHRLLRYDPSHNEFVYNERHKLDIDALILDEVSMVDMVLMSRLLQALPEECRVVFLGDKDQLPSVEAGTVLGDLVPRDCKPLFSGSMAGELRKVAPDVAPDESVEQNSLTDRIVLLAKSHRNQGRLAEAAAAVNAGQAPELSSAPDKAQARVVVDLNKKISKHEPGARLETDNINWSEPKTDCIHLADFEHDKPEHLRCAILSFSRFFYEQKMGEDEPSLRELVRSEFPARGLINETATDEERQKAMDRARKLFDCFSRFRILALLRRGPFGVSGINNFLARQWRQVLDKQAPARLNLFAGAPIIITKNTPERALYNGDLGVIVRAEGRCYYGLFQRGDMVMACPAERLPEHEPAFAVTVHKSQGSQYANVLLALPPDLDSLLFVREILYTGITRAENSAFIFGSREAIEKAISRRIERQSRVSLFA